MTVIRSCTALGHDYNALHKEHSKGDPFLPSLYPGEAISDPTLLAERSRLKQKSTLPFEIKLTLSPIRNAQVHRIDCGFVWNHLCERGCLIDDVP
jgi:hypothetical protein